MVGRFHAPDAAALKGLQVQQAAGVGASRTTPGSFDALAVLYYRSPDFLGLKATTQATRRRIIERFRKEHGTKPLKLLKRAHLTEIIGAKASTPQAANNLLKILRVMLDFAVAQDMIEANPAIGVTLDPTEGEGFHPWSEADIAQYQAHHPLGTKARLALELLLWTGQRREDVC